MTILDEPRTAGVQPAAMPPADGVCRVRLLDGDAEAHYRRRRRWAITLGAMHGGVGSTELALSQYLEVLRARRLRPLFAAVPDPSPFARRGLYTHFYGWQAVVHLPGNHVATTVHPPVRRDIEAADRAGVTVLPYRPGHAAQLAEFAPGLEVAGPGAEAWVAVSATGAVLGVAGWQFARELHDGGPVPDIGSSAGRVLRLAAARAQAPSWVMELLLAASIDEYRWRGVGALCLGWRSAARWLPVLGVAAGRGLTGVVSRFGPRWEQRWLAIPSGWQLPAAAWVLR